MVLVKSLIGSSMVFVALATSSLAPACAQDERTSSAANLAMNNLSHEYLNCSTYYTIVSQCLGNNRSDKELAEKYDKIAESVLAQSYLFGKKAGMMDEAMVARLRIAMDEQKTAIGNNCVNISILNLKYGESCKKLTEDPARAFEAYYAKALEELPE